MTKVLCAADLHLGAGSDYGREPGDRLRDQEQAWIRVGELAEQHGCPVTLFVGDAFHTARPSPDEMLAFSRGLNAMPHTRVIAIPGNHDTAGANPTTGLHVFADAHGPDSFTLVDRPRIIDTGVAQIACLPWTPTSRLAASMEHTDRSDVQALASEHLTVMAAAMRAKCDPDRPAILMAHWSVTGGRSSTGQAADFFGEVVLPLHELQAQRWDACILGHLHPPAVLSEDPFVAYTGSVATVSFAEAGHGHGALLLDIDDDTRQVDRCFVEIPERPFVTLMLTEDNEGLTLDWTDHQRAFDWLRYGVVDVEDAVVRVRYTATPEQSRLVDHQAIALSLLAAGAHKVFGIQAEITKPDRGRLDHALQHLADQDEEQSSEVVEAGSLTPLQAIEAWVISQGLEEATAEALRARTAAYLQRGTPAPAGAAA